MIIHEEPIAQVRQGRDGPKSADLDQLTYGKGARRARWRGRFGSSCQQRATGYTAGMAPASCSLLTSGPLEAAAELAAEFLGPCGASALHVDFAGGQDT
jgi:hypothetical protein